MSLLSARSKIIQSQPIRQISHDINPKTFKQAYNDLKQGGGIKYAEQFSTIPLVNPQGVFGNNNCSLKYIKGYGFDYDHTLANYNTLSGSVIYENAMNFLIKHENYPIELAQKNEFNPDWAIRGLQFDRLHGNVMKLNQFHKLNPRTIYNGHETVAIKQILEQYGGMRISETYYKKYFKDLGDLFGVPETCLYCDVLQFLKDKKYDFEVEYIADDIKRAIDYVHDGGIFHKTVGLKPDDFVTKLPELSSYIKKLRDGDKQIFLLTNSSYDYINNACDYLFEDVVTDLGLKHWTQVFNWTFTCAQKPKWFSKTGKHANVKFRPLNIENNPANDINGNNNLIPFKSIDHLEEHGVYTGGSLQEFHKLTQLRNDQVIYFGDNVGSDLIGPSKTGQWKTVAIIKELEREIEVNNDTEFRKCLSYLLDVEHLWFDAQHLKSQKNEEINKMLSELSDERGEYREIIKRKYNQQFGSIFRTHATRTLFFHRLARYSDLYTSKVTNMLEYPLNYKFGARRQFYDHEPVL